MAGFAQEVKAENEEELPDSDPHWGIDVVFLKNTTLCYGPWVDRQRLVNAILFSNGLEQGRHIRNPLTNFCLSETHSAKQLDFVIFSFSLSG